MSQGILQYDLNFKKTNTISFKAVCVCVCESVSLRFNFFTIPVVTLQLNFQALDKFSRVVDTSLGIEVKITDTNDNAPKFDRERYETTIEESTIQGN